MVENKENFEIDGLQKVYNFFIEAKKELKTKNRFSNEKLDSLIKFLIGLNSQIENIDEGVLLYRGRIYDKEDAEKRFKNDDSIFQGYDKENSFVNTKIELVNDGRCNPRFIPYLYAAESPICCIHENRPNIGSYVSIAKIIINEKIKILNLAMKFMMCNAEPYFLENVSNSTVLFYLSNFFSKPFQNEGDYILTQYISEKIKNEGFDGISFHSAVYSGKNNTNYVIFNYDKCEVVGSRLYKVNNIKMSVESSQPYK